MQILPFAGVALLIVGLATTRLRPLAYVGAALVAGYIIYAFVVLSAIH